VTQHQHLVVLIANTKIDVATAIEINKLFCEVVIAPEYDAEAIEILQQKKNIILIQKRSSTTTKNKLDLV
jgi:AICAR transformylase/IMP cyclohydrolase PurH